MKETSLQNLSSRSGCPWGVAGYGGWDCLYLIWDLTGFTSLAPSSCSMQGYIHLFYPAMSLYHTHSRTESPKLRSVIIIPIICKLELPFEREDCNCKVFIISQYEYLWWPGGIVYMCSYCLIFVYSEQSGPQTQVRLPWCGVSRLKREICKLLTGPGVCRHHCPGAGHYFNCNEGGAAS